MNQQRTLSTWLLLAACICASLALVPFLDALFPSGNGVLTVELDPPRPDLPSYAYASRARWSTLLSDMGSRFVSNVLGQIGGGLFGPRQIAQVIEVGKTGARYSTICGMTSGTGGANSCGDATHVCASGSAYAAADALTNDPNHPVIIHVNPGVYNECVHFNNITDVALIGSGQDVTIIRPTVTAVTDVSNGVVRFGALTTTRNSTARIELAGFTIQNDASSAPEAAVQLGKEGGPTGNTFSSWTDIYTHDNTIIGSHDGWQCYGSKLIGDKDVPRAWLLNSKVIGSDAGARKGLAKLRVVGNEFLSQPNYCDFTDVAHMVASSGVISSGTSTTVFILPATEGTPAAAPSSQDGFYAGRGVKVTPTVSAVGVCATGGTCTGTVCTAGLIGDTCAVNADCDGVYRVISTYVGSSRTVTAGPTMGFTPDNSCSYAIEAVTHDNGQPYVSTDPLDIPCTDIAWRALRSGVQWKSTLWHESTTMATPDGTEDDSLMFLDNWGTININSWPPALSSSACTGQEHIAPFLLYQGTHGSVTIDNFRATVNVNVRPGVATCINPIAGIDFTGNGKYYGPVTVRNSTVTINNRADKNNGVVGLNAKSTGTAFSVYVDGFYSKITNPAGYVGASYTAYQANNTTPVVIRGGLSSPDLVTTFGTINGDNPTVCASVSSLDETTFDQTILFDNSGRAFAVEAIGCRCQSPGGANCGTLAQIDYQTLGGTAVGTTFTCADEGAAITWQDTRTVAAATFAAGGGIMFLVNDTPGTTLNNNYFICARYTSTER